MNTNNTTASDLDLDDDDLNDVADALRTALKAVTSADGMRNTQARRNALRIAKANVNDARGMLRDLITLCTEPTCTACGEAGSDCACEPGGTFE